MADKKSGKEASPSVMSRPEHIEAPKDGSTLSGEPSSSRRPFLKIERFSTRQSGFTVPVPSYLRHGDISGSKTRDLTSTVESSLPGSEQGLEEDETAPNSNDAATVNSHRRRKIVFRWAYVLIAIFLYVILRMLERLN